MNVTAVVGGTVVTPDGPRRADVLISGGTVARLTEAGPVEAGPVEAGAPLSAARRRRRPAMMASHTVS